MSSYVIKLDILLIDIFYKRFLISTKQKVKHEKVGRMSSSVYQHIPTLIFSKVLINRMDVDSSLMIKFFLNLKK